MHSFPVDLMKNLLYYGCSFLMVDPCKNCVFKNCHKFILPFYYQSIVGFKCCFMTHLSVLCASFKGVIANGLMNWRRATYNANWDQKL